MITRTHYNGVKSIALRLEALRQQLERIVDEVDGADIGSVNCMVSPGFTRELAVDHDDLEALISHLNETAHKVGKHLGIDSHGTHDS